MFVYVFVGANLVRDPERPVPNKVRSYTAREGFSYGFISHHFFYRSRYAPPRSVGAGREISLSEEKSLEITPRTLPPHWGGETMDYNYAQQLLEQYDREDR
jgi:hypothetical protein